MTPDEQPTVVRNRAVRLGWFAGGWIAVAIGGVGVVVPGLPSTGFFVIAASCFARSSPRFERWVLGLPGVGAMVQDYRAGLGMPRRAKVTAVTMMWVAIGLSAGLAIHTWWVRLAVVLLGVVGTWYLLVRIPTKAPPA